jgi:hypothetical protein
VQERFTESVGLRTGDRIRISLTIPTSMVVSVGFLTGDDVYTPIVEHEWLDPGEHLLPDTFEATSGELDDLVVFADADVVDAAKSSGDFEPLNSIEIVDEEAAGLIDSDQEDGGEQEGRARVSVDWPGLLVHRTLAPRFGFRSPPGSADQIAEEDPEPADVGQFGHWAVGHRHGCRVLQRGYLECWGDNTSGQTTPPPGLYSRVSAGRSHSCGIRLDRTLECWGDNSFGQLTAPSGEFSSVSTDGDNNCALSQEGIAACWGARVTGAPEVPLISVDASPNHACGIDHGGALHCWGDNSAGQATPPEGTFTKVASGRGFSCALDEEGTVDCWGASEKMPEISTQHDGDTGHRALFAYGGSACAVKHYMDLQCWGDAAFIGKHPNEEFSGEVFLGEDFACGMMYHTGGVTCWGNNEAGQTEAPTDYDNIVIGGSHICAVDRERVTCRGDDSAGQLVYPPPLSARGANFVDIEAGDSFTCAMRNHEYLTERLSCWGSNEVGQLDYPEVPPGDPSDPCGGDCDGAYMRVMAVGARHACANKFPKGVSSYEHRDGHPDVRTVCWGDNTKGQATPPDVYFVALTAGDAHTCGRTADHRILCWGDNERGQLAVPALDLDPEDMEAPFEAGGNTTCVLDAEDQLRCWGDDAHGQASPPAVDPPFSRHGAALSVSRTRTCALLQDSRKLHCWGVNGNESFGSEAGFRSVSVRDAVTCVTEHNGAGYCWGDHLARADRTVPQVVDAGPDSAVINRGIDAFRFPDSKGDTCSGCHAPDGVDLAYTSIDRETFLRRGQGHLVEEKALDVWYMLQALRARSSWSSPVPFGEFRPGQPGGEVLPGDTAEERDEAFAEALDDDGLLIARGEIDSLAKAKRARDQLLELNLADTRVGIPMALYSSDGFRGEEFMRVTEWIPSTGHRAAPGRQAQLRQLQANYLRNPTDATLAGLVGAIANTQDPVVVFNYDDTGGHYDRIERVRYLALLVLSHEMRREMMGQPRRPAWRPGQNVEDFFWSLGAVAAQSAELCQAAHDAEDTEIRDTGTPAQCVLLPQPFRSRLPLDCGDSEAGEDCHDMPKDLLDMAASFMWFSATQNPGLVDKGQEESRKEAQLIHALHERDYYAHAVFAQAYHRVHKHYGTDQGWRETNPPDVSLFLNVEDAEHEDETYQRLLANTKAMFRFLAAEPY